MRDVKGKTIGINGFSTSGHLWLKTALEKAGLAEIRRHHRADLVSRHGQSLLSGKLDVGQFPQPFDAMLHKQAKVTKLFSAKDAIPYDEELLVLIAKEEFLSRNAAAVRAMLEDLRTATAVLPGAAEGGAADPDRHQDGARAGRRVPRR